MIPTFPLFKLSSLSKEENILFRRLFFCPPHPTHAKGEWFLPKGKPRSWNWLRYWWVLFEKKIIETRREKHFSNNVARGKKRQKYFVNSMLCCESQEQSMF